MAGSEDEYSLATRIPMALLLVVIIMVGLVGNGLICWSIYKNKELRKTVNSWFILNMALANVGVLIFCVFFPLVTYFQGYWIFNDGACQFSGFMNSILMLASILTLTMISLHQYFTVVSKWDQIKLRKSAVIMLVYVWAHSLLLSVLPLTRITSYDLKRGRGQCAVKIPESPAEKLTATMYIVTGFFIPLLIMSGSYYRIMRTVSRHARTLSRRMSTQNASIDRKAMQKKVAVTMIIVLIMFLVCWTPFLIMSLLGAYIPALSTPELGNFGFLLGFANSCCNPVILGTRNRAFKYEYLEVFNALERRLCGCLGKSQQHEKTVSRLENSEVTDHSVVYQNRTTGQCDSDHIVVI
eukprot:gene16108-17729_t